MTAQPLPVDDMADPGPDRRQETDRYVSIFRAGKLSRMTGEELCVLRNISPGGAMLNHNGEIAPGERVTLDLRLDENLSGKVAWAQDGRCGLAFDEPCDLPRILAGHNEGLRPRPPRVHARARATLIIGPGQVPATLRDISQTGACLCCDELAVPRVPELRVGLEGMGDYRAIVRWRRAGHIGVGFASTLPMWELNNWLRAQRDA